MSSVMSKEKGPLRIGLVGYGTGGKNFHAPFIEAAEGIELAGVVARSRRPRPLPLGAEARYGVDL